MFGQKDDNQNAGDGSGDPMQAVNDGAAQLLANEHDPNAGPPAVASAASAPPPPASETWQHPGAPLPPPASNNPDDSIRDVISPAGGYPSAPNNRISTDTPVVPAGNAALVSNGDVTDADLVDIKQKALSELIPLIDKLGQPPQEKFRTIMMMIQASDDQRLVEKAYESASAIEDEEVRAQALLDIVNEINYFTQQPEG